MGHFSNKCSRLTSQPRGTPICNDFNRCFNNNNNNTNNAHHNPTVNASARFVNAVPMDQNMNENTNNQYQQHSDFQQQQDMSHPITCRQALSTRLINCNFTNDISQQFCDNWILDSGASSHMTNRQDFFNKLDMKDTKMKIKTATGQTVDIEGVGKVDFIPIINGEEGEVVTLLMFYMLLNLTLILFCSPLS